MFPTKNLLMISSSVNGNKTNIKLEMSNDSAV